MEEKYLPIVSIEEMLKFDANREETHTKSRFINHFLRLFYRKPATITEISLRMGVKRYCASEMFRVETGMRFTDFMQYWAAYKIHLVMERCDSQHAELQGMMAQMRALATAALGKNEKVDDKELKRLFRGFKQRIERAEAMSYGELYEHVRIYSRAGLARFVNSKRYAQIVSEMKFRKFVSVYKQYPVRSVNSYEEFFRAMKLNG